MKDTGIKLKKPFADIYFWFITLFCAFIFLMLIKQANSFLLNSALGSFFIILGFGLPRWIGRKKRDKGFIQKKIKEKQSWGFCSRDREGPWINYIDYPLVKKTSFADGKRFFSEWLVIHDGYIIINPGVVVKVDRKKKIVEYDYTRRRTYAWDGCTPKVFFYWIILLGTPDWWQKKERILTISDSGKIQSREIFWQMAHHASLVHDALYQYLDSIPIAKMHVDKLFYEMLLESGLSWPVAKLYHLAVRFLGASDVKENNPRSNSELKVKSMP